jgi:hypothetical protein
MSPDEARRLQLFQTKVHCDVKSGWLTPTEAEYLQGLLVEGHGVESAMAQHDRLVRPRLRRTGMRWLIATVLLILLAIALNAFAQIPFLPIGPGEPVYDAANHLQNTISAVEAVLQTAHWVIEQLALESFVVVEDLAEDLAAIEALVQEAQALGWELSSLQTQILVLFDLDTAPMTSFEYRERQMEIRRSIWQAYSYAMRTQTLIRSVLRTVGHIAGILENVAEALGNLSVSQTFGESQAKLQQLLVEANVTRTAFERAKSLEGAETGVLLQGLHNINEALLADHPRR